MKKIDDMDKLLPLVVKKIVEEERESFSCSDIQRMLDINYPRSARIVDQMREMGIATETRPLKLNISSEEYSQLLEMCEM